MSYKRKVLRVTEQCAQRTHCCDQCESEIFAGDRYEVRIEVRSSNERKILWVTKVHIYPDCIFDPGSDIVLLAANTNSVLEFQRAA